MLAARRSARPAPCSPRPPKMLAGYTTAKWRPRKFLFNIGENQLAAFGAAAAIEGLRATGNFDNTAFLIAGGGLAGFIVFTIRVCFVSTIVSMNSGRSVASTYRDNFAWLLPHHVVLGMVAGGLAIAYGYMGVASILVLALPLLMSRYSMQQFVDRTRDNVLRLEKSEPRTRTSAARSWRASRLPRSPTTPSSCSCCTRRRKPGIRATGR